MLPPDAAPKSNTASFTKNWAKDLPDDSFLHEIVSRWRAQTYNPDSAGYSIDTAAAPPPPAAPPAAAAPAMAHPAQPGIRRAAPMPGQPGQPPRPAASGFGQQMPPQRAAAPQPTAQESAAQQQSLSNLIKQFRS
jgi:hypothetical protein